MTQFGGTRPTEETFAAAPPSEPKRSSLSPIRIVLIIVGIVLLALALLGAFIYWSITNSFRPAAAVPAPIAWQSAQVVLSAEQPVLDGHLSVTAITASQSDLRVGLNVGLPRSENSVSGLSPAVPSKENADPATLLTIPSVRVSTMNAGAIHVPSCLAPCELSLGNAFTCNAGTCRLEVDFRLELIAGSASDAVHVAASGSAATGLGKQLPAGLQLEFSVAGAAGGS